MILRVTKQGVAGGKKQVTGRDPFYDRQNALEFLELDIALGFKPITAKPGNVVLEQYTKNYTRVEHRAYDGPICEMAKLVQLAKAHMVAATVSA